MYAQHSIKLPTTTDGDSYLPVKLTGEKMISGVFRAVLRDSKSTGLFSTYITKSIFSSLFPQLENYNYQDLTPFIKVNLHLPRQEFNKFGLFTYVRFRIINEKVLISLTNP